MTAFRDHTTAFIQHLRETKRPLTLTVEGKAAVVVQDAEAYQRLLDLAADASVEEGIRQGLEEMDAGLARPAEEVFDEIRQGRGSLIHSVNRALLGEVSPYLRAVTVRLHNHTIYLKFYFDGDPSDDDKESVGCIGAEVIADYPAPYLIDEEIIVAPAPEPILYEENWMTVYRRKELTPPS